MKGLVLLLVAILLAGCRSEIAAPVKQNARQPVHLTDVQRGRLVYLKYGCKMCHGTNGEKGIPNPNSQTSRIPALTYVKEGYSIPELRVRILMGTPYVPSADPKKPPPPYRMPGWEGLMTEQEMKDLYAYLYSLMPKGEKETW